ncbi:MAG: DUF3558 family protein [Pseudonocardiales bacterium]|nr:DUF3558 family protein [Pseudonocardiales bacterium]
MVAMVGLLAAACGSRVPPAPAPPAVADASRVDMCTILTDQELTGLGIQGNTRKPEKVLGVVGCGWLGKPFTLRLERDKETVASYVARRNDPSFVAFAQNTVHGRAGVQIQLRRSGDQCDQSMDGGTVSLTVGVAASFSLDPQPIDACAEALRIAEMIEPRLPTTG